MIAIPNTAITGKAGTLNVLVNPGCFTLKIQTAIQTIVKANKVPKLVMSANLLIGVNAATVAITAPRIIKFVFGVPEIGFTLEKTCGIKPSLDIPRKILDCPMIITINTETKPIVAATVIIEPAQPCPAISNA
ncbi:hypothetical protein D3C80_1256310 [compost metagenome]